jgi:hypothetical protein
MGAMDRADASMSGRVDHRRGVKEDVTGFAIASLLDALRSVVAVYGG